MKTTTQHRLNTPYCVDKKRMMKTIDNWKIIKTMDIQGAHNVTYIVESMINGERGIMKMTQGFLRDVLFNENLVYDCLSKQTDEIQSYFPKRIQAVTMYDKDHDYIVIEYIQDTQTLYTFYEDTTSRSDIQISAHMDQLGDIVRILEKLNVTHGDLHGNNILVKYKDPTHPLKVIDFGLSFVYLGNYSYRYNKIFFLMFSFISMKGYLTLMAALKYLNVDIYRGIPLSFEMSKKIIDLYTNLSIGTIVLS